ncbi:hypothetical protein [Acetobacter sp. P1H12_c]|uniref:hypothetical protein n=1 Tax=Acetobacter sp. P1H12_c TaxID=2762621 RepID=UPI00207B8D07|nr:hypothetical protein [Acetobacter sp. P1H12_c]
MNDRKDPSTERGEERTSPTISQFCKFFIERHVKTHLKSTTQAASQRATTLFIAKKIGRRKRISTTRSDVVTFRYTYRHVPYQANRTLGLLSKIFSLAILWSVLTRRSQSMQRREMLQEAEA